MDFCANDPCPDGHRCIDHGDDFTCECPGGRNGPDCNQVPRTVSSSPWIKNGKKRKRSKKTFHLVTVPVSTHTHIPTNGDRVSKFGYFHLECFLMASKAFFFNFLHQSSNDGYSSLDDVFYLFSKFLLWRWQTLDEDFSLKKSAWNFKWKVFTASKKIRFIVKNFPTSMPY